MYNANATMTYDTTVVSRRTFVAARTCYNGIAGYAMGTNMTNGLFRGLPSPCCIEISIVSIRTQTICVSRVVCIVCVRRCVFSWVVATLVLIRCCCCVRNERQICVDDSRSR
jgi:hypothetical protein